MTWLHWLTFAVFYGWMPFTFFHLILRHFAED